MYRRNKLLLCLFKKSQCLARMFKKLSRNFVAQAMANLRHRYLCEEILSVTVLQELF